MITFNEDGKWRQESRVVGMLMREAFFTLLREEKIDETVRLTDVA